MNAFQYFNNYLAFLHKLHKSDEKYIKLKEGFSFLKETEHFLHAQNDFTKFKCKTRTVFTFGRVRCMLKIVGLNS